MPAIFFALISYVGWGVGDIFVTIASRRIGGYSTALWYAVLQIAFFSLLTPYFLDDLKGVTSLLLAVNIIIGVIGTVGLLAFYEGLKIGNPSLVATIVSSYTAVAVILSIIFLKESISVFQALSILIIFVGIITSMLDFRELKNRALNISKGILLALVAMLAFGIYWTFIKIPVREIGWFWPQMISQTTFPITLLFMKLRRLNLQKPTVNKALAPLIASAIMIGISSFSFNHAISQGLTAIVAPIAGAYPTLFVLLAFLIFKDPITKQQIAGIITTLLGIVLLSISSV